MGKQIRITAPTAEGALLRLLDVCNPSDIATAVDLFIERLDQMAGDPDLETNGDELDGCMAEDDFCDHNLAYPGPGCPVSDGGCSTDSGAGDPAWAEWHTRGRHKVGALGEEVCRREDGNMAHDDDEDDDPREATGDERDTGDAEDDELTATAWLAAHDQHDGPGCYGHDGHPLAPRSKGWGVLHWHRLDSFSEEANFLWRRTSRGRSENLRPILDF